MARASRSPAIYHGDNHGAAFTNYDFVMLIPDTDIADTHRKWGTPAGGEDGLSTRLNPRHVIGVDAAGNHGRAIIPDVTSDIWSGVTNTFSINGVTFTVTGYVGEKRTRIQLDPVLILPPTNMNGAGTTEVLGPIVHMDAGTHVLTPTVQLETFTGSNSALYVRVYMLASNSYGGVQLHVFDPWVIGSAVSSPLTGNIDVSPYIPCYVGVTIQGNNSSVTTWRAWVSLLTDLGLATSLNGNGCCHDPLLDTIYAALHKVY